MAGLDVGDRSSPQARAVAQPDNVVVTPRHGRHRMRGAFDARLFNFHRHERARTSLGLPIGVLWNLAPLVDTRSRSD